MSLGCSPDHQRDFFFFFFFFWERWGAHRFAAIVTDNAANMVVARRLVLEKFPKMVDVRYI